MADRYLVTGAAGFVGSWYTRHLLDKGHEVVALDRIDSAGYLGRLDPRAKFVRHDLASELNSHVDRAIGHVDYVVHLAAGSHVDRSVTDPECFLFDNVVATFRLLQWARTRPLKKFLNMSTDEVFGSAPNGVSFKEHDVFNPTNPYSATKTAAEMLCPAWSSTYDIPIVIARSTNIYGSGQDREKYIPLAAERILKGELLQIHADANTMASSTRMYLHISDVCRGFDTILEKGGILGGTGAGRYNLSGDTEHSNLDVAQHIAELLGKPLRYELVSFVPNRPKHDQRYSVSWTKLAALGWEPRVGLLEGLREAVG